MTQSSSSIAKNNGLTSCRLWHCMCFYLGRESDSIRLFNSNPRRNLLRWMPSPARWSRSSLEV